MFRLPDFLLMTFVGIVVVAAFVLYVVRSKRKTDRNRNSITFENLREMVVEMLNEYVSFNDGKTGYSKDYQAEIASSIRNCCSGKSGDREVVKTIILDFLRDEIKLNEQEADRILGSLGAEAEFILLLTTLEKTQENTGFSVLWKEELKDIVDGKHEIIEEDIHRAKQECLEKITFGDKVKALGQLLYAYTVGLGAIDMLNYETGLIEEIQIGMSGFAKEEYDYRRAYMEPDKKDSYARDSIHILISGRTIRLSFLSFHADDELVRVLRNLIKNTTAPEITGKNPKVITDTIDGRRITVSRPPFTDSWAGLIRKFDTAVILELEQMYKDNELVKVIRQLLKEAKSIAVTGEMATGKTTLLRALLCELGGDKNMRIIESESFELDMRKYLPEANTLTLRTEDQKGFDEVLGFAKKTTGQVFVLGEISSMPMARLAVEVSKLSNKLFFTAHYKTTLDMYAGFATALLNTGGFKDYSEAEKEAIRALDVDIHLCNINGNRQIQYINRITEKGEVINVWKAEQAYI